VRARLAVIAVAAALAGVGVFLWRRSEPAPAPAAASPSVAPAAALSVDAGGASAPRFDELPEDSEPEDPADDPSAPCAFEGTVTERGQPASGASVALRDGGESVKTDQRGHFRLEARCADGAVRATRGTSSGIASGYPAPDAALEIELGDGSALIATVDDATGAVVPARAINLLRGHLEGGELQGYTAIGFDARQTAEGTLIAGLAGGPYEVSVWADGYALADATPFEVHAPQRTAVKIPLTRTRPIVGRVVDATDRPVAGAQISCAGDDDKSTVAGGDGAFSLPCDPSERCVVARHAEHSAAAVRGSSGTPVKIVLGRPAVLELEVKSARGEGVPHAELTLSDKSECGLRLWKETDASGRARAEDVPPGSYVARAHADGWASSDEIDVTVTEGSVARASLVLPDALRISGTVLTSTGAPAAGAHVKACKVLKGSVPTNGNGVMGQFRAEVKTDGTFELTGLSRTAYAVDAQSADGQQLTEMAIVDAGTTGEVLRFPRP
jgi:hypothetical protein